MQLIVTCAYCNGDLALSINDHVVMKPREMRLGAPLKCPRCDSTFHAYPVNAQ